MCNHLSEVLGAVPAAANGDEASRRSCHETLRIFELSNGRYRNLLELAQAMGVATGHVCWVRLGKRHSGEKFIIGALKAFPECGFDDLFYVTSEDEPLGKARQLRDERRKDNEGPIRRRQREAKDV